MNFKNSLVNKESFLKDNVYKLETKPKYISQEEIWMGVKSKGYYYTMPIIALDSYPQIKDYAIFQEKIPVLAKEDRRYLYVPYEEKEEFFKRVTRCKLWEKGATFDTGLKQWFIPNNAPIEPFKLWTKPIQKDKFIYVSNLTESEIYADFILQMRRVGVELNDDLKVDGEKHRASVTHKLSFTGRANTDAEYCIYPNYRGIPRGWVHDYTTGEYTDLVVTDVTKKLDPIESANRKEQIERNKKEREVYRLQQEALGLEKIKTVWEDARPINNKYQHNYLLRKKVEIKDSFNLRVSRDTGDLLIPVQTLQGYLVGLQCIAPNGNKKNYPKSKMSGNFFCLSGTERIILCEGVATGLTLKEADPNANVICALSVYNFRPVAQNLRLAYPQTEIIICSDNDIYKSKNIGLETALTVGELIGAKVYFPEFKTQAELEARATDFNDLAVFRGISAVKQCLGINCKKLDKTNNIVL